MERLDFAKKVLRHVWAEFIEHFNAAAIAHHLYSKELIDDTTMDVILKVKSEKDANQAFLLHLRSNATIESLEKLCKLLRDTARDHQRHDSLAKSLEDELKQSKAPLPSPEAVQKGGRDGDGPSYSLSTTSELSNKKFSDEDAASRLGIVAALDLSKGTSQQTYTDVYLAKDPPHRKVETAFFRLQSRLASVFNKHCDFAELKLFLRLRKKNEEWPFKELDVEDIDSMKDIRTIFGKICINWLNTEAFIRLMNVLPDEKSRDDAKRLLEDYHKLLEVFSKWVLLSHIPKDDARSEHFYTFSKLSVTYNVIMEDFDVSKLLKQQKFLSKIFQIPEEDFHYLKAERTNSTLVTWALDISIEKAFKLFQRVTHEFWSLKEHLIIKVEIESDGIFQLHMKGRNLPYQLKKALQGNQDLLVCTEHVSRQFLALVDYSHLQRKGTEPRLQPALKSVLQPSGPSNVAESETQRQARTGDALKKSAMADCVSLPVDRLDERFTPHPRPTHEDEDEDPSTPTSERGKEEKDAQHAADLGNLPLPVQETSRTPLQTFTCLERDPQIKEGLYMSIKSVLQPSGPSNVAESETQRQARTGDVMAQCSDNPSRYAATKPTERDLKVVADRAGSNWSRLLTNLGIPWATIQSIRMESPTNLWEACTRGFVLWLKEGASDSNEPVTFGTLFAALRKSEMADCVSLLVDRLDERSTPHPRPTHEDKDEELLYPTRIKRRGKEKTTLLQAKDIELRFQPNWQDALIAELLEEIQRLKQENNLIHRTSFIAEEPASSSSTARPFIPGQNMVFRSDRVRPGEHRSVKMADLLIPTCNATPVTIGRDVYLAGGATGEVETAQLVQVYNLDSGDCRTLPPSPQYDSAAVAIDGTLVLIGGWDSSTGKPTNMVSTWMAAEERWTQDRLPPMKMTRSRPGVLLLNNHLFVFSGIGVDGKILLDSFEVLDLNTKQWSEDRGGLPQPLSSPQLGVFGDYAMLYGGFTSDIKATSKCYTVPVQVLVDSVTNPLSPPIHWTPVQDAPYYYSALLSTSHDAMLIGGQRDRLATRAIHRFSSSGSWEVIGELSEPRALPTVVAVSDREFLVLGGYSDPRKVYPSSLKSADVISY